MTDFRVSIHAVDQTPGVGEPISWAGATCSTLVCSREDLRPLPLSFEQAVARLQSIPQCFVELDGSFFCRGEQHQQTWHWEGALHDQGDSLHCVELWGSCPASALQVFRRSVLPTPEDLLVVNLADAGVWLSVAQWLEGMS